MHEQEIVDFIRRLGVVCVRDCGWDVVWDDEEFALGEAGGRVKSKQRCDSAIGGAGHKALPRGIFVVL